MAWVPSHTSLAHHPKLRRAASIAGVSEPAMIGHLHLLWWFALDLAPEGDLSRYDAHDLAIAAKFDGDPDVFVKALQQCGPAGTVGFLTLDMRLHDWDDYGGKYTRKVEAGRESAKRRWDRQKRDEAQSEETDLMAGQYVPNGLPMGTQWVPTTEERREEKKPIARTVKVAGTARPRNKLWDAVVEACGWDGKLTKSQQGRVAAAVKELADIGADPAEVIRRAAIYRMKYQGMDVTPTALSANWASIAQAPAGKFTDAGRGGVFFDD